MKHYVTISAVFIVTILLIAFLGCEGKDGPAGPAGPTGPTGPTGKDGQSFGNATCGTCHNVSTTVLAKQIQWEASTHATGGNFDHNSASCAKCHTHEGFRQKIAGEEVTSQENPTPPNCRTCHNIHKNYDETDFALSITGAAEIESSIGPSTTADFGKGSICAHCHHNRPYGYTLAVGGGDYEMTSRSFGPHHGPQGNILAGYGGYEVSGSLSYANSSHTTMVTDGCVTCHMATPSGVESGGHTMRPNTAGCESCHSGIESFDVNGVQTEVGELLAELAVLLIDKGIMTEAGGNAVAGTYPSDVAGARFNYQMCLEDRSNGVHNAKYVKALLTNSIESFKK